MRHGITTSLLLFFSLFSESVLFSQPLVYPGDFIYKGAFRLPPQQVGGSRFGYGGTAPVYHALHNSLYMVGHDWDQKVAEVSIPDLVISDDIDDLNTAIMLQPFRDISEGLMYDVDEGTIKVGGLLVHDNKLIESVWTYYDADGSQVLSHCTSDTNILITGDVDGMFQLGESGAGYVSGYMTLLPQNWITSFGGPAISGQCCIPIISRSSYGPAAFVYEPDVLGDSDPVPVIPLVYYPDDHPLSAWNSTGPLFNGTTSISGVLVPENRRSLLFVGSHGIGPFCYGTGEDCDDPVISSQGTHAYPYKYQIWGYDLLDLEDVKNGLMEPWETTPYAIWNFDFPITDENKQIGGAAYDPVSGRIFISQLRMDGFDALPLVHVFDLRGPHIFVDSSVTSSLKNGASWTTAFTKLQDALAISHVGDTILMAKGTYYPDEGTGHTANSRTESFVLKDGVVLSGGYPSGGGTRNPVTNKVLLSGDIDQNDLRRPALMASDVIGNNAYNIVKCENGALDGIILSGGKANADSNAQYRRGSGIYCQGGCTLNNCSLLVNVAQGTGVNGQGGGVYQEAGVLTMRDVLFDGNYASGQGSAWFSAVGSIIVQQNVQVKD